MKKCGNYVEQVLKIEPGDYLPLVRLALQEDAVSLDVTSKSIFQKNDQCSASLLSRQSGILCGIEVFKAVFHSVDPNLTVKTKFKDGDTVSPDAMVAEIKGATLSVLRAERTALNFISMLSGISTQARYVATLLGSSGICALDTRKTLPGYRILSKYAVHTGGALNHQLNLSDMGLIKDNHIAASGSISMAIRKFKKKYPELKCEVEVETEQDLNEALAEFPDMILLDNMTVAQLSKCSKIVKKFNQANSTKITCEASGGFHAGNVKKILKTGVDFVSMGSLTNTVHPLDFSLEINLQ